MLNHLTGEKEKLEGNEPTDPFVFLQCLQDVTIASGDDARLQTQGTCLIVRYQRVRELVLQGEVQLL